MSHVSEVVCQFITVQIANLDKMPSDQLDKVIYKLIKILYGNCSIYNYSPNNHDNYISEYSSLRIWTVYLFVIYSCYN